MKAPCNVEQFIADWMSKPLKDRVYGNYYTKIVNNKSFFLSSTFDGTCEVRLIAFRCLNTDKVVLNLQADSVLPGIKSRNGIFGRDFIVYDLFLLEQKFKEDVTELQILDHDPLYQRTLVECESKRYLFDISLDEMLPIAIKKYRTNLSEGADHPVHLSFALDNKYTIIPTKGKTLAEARLLSYPEYNNDDIIISSSCYLTPCALYPVEQLSPDIIKDSLYCPDVTSHGTSFSSALAPESPISSEMWKYLRAKFLTSLKFRISGDIIRDLHAAGANYIGSSEKGDMLVNLNNLIYAVKPRTGFAVGLIPGNPLRGGDRVGIVSDASSSVVKYPNNDLEFSVFIP